MLQYSSCHCKVFFTILKYKGILSTFLKMKHKGLSNIRSLKTPGHILGKVQSSSSLQANSITVKTIFLNPFQEDEVGSAEENI